MAYVGTLKRLNKKENNNNFIRLELFRVLAQLLYNYYFVDVVVVAAAAAATGDFEKQKTVFYSSPSALRMNCCLLSRQICIFSK